MPDKMTTPEPTPPEIRDYYFDLGIHPHATNGTIKKAFHRLALLHHPDKTAPGKTVDSQRFREVSTN